MDKGEPSYWRVSERISSGREMLKEVAIDGYNDTFAFILPMHFSAAIYQLTSATSQLMSILDPRSDFFKTTKDSFQKAEGRYVVSQSLGKGMQGLETLYWERVNIRAYLAEAEQILSAELLDMESEEGEVESLEGILRKFRSFPDDLEHMLRALKTIGRDSDGAVRVKEDVEETKALVEEAKAMRKRLADFSKEQGEEIRLKKNEVAKEPAKKRVEVLIAAFQQQAVMFELFTCLCEVLNGFFTANSGKKSKSENKIEGFHKKAVRIAEDILKKSREDLQKDQEASVHLVLKKQAEIVEEMVEPLFETAEELNALAESYNWQRVPPRDEKEEMKFRDESVKEIKKHLDAMEKLKEKVSKPKGDDEWARMHRRYKALRDMFWELTFIVSAFSDKYKPREKPPDTSPLRMFRKGA
ncbi:MAG: hypothetical protein ABH829_05745 [archaeon]